MSFKPNNSSGHSIRVLKKKKKKEKKKNERFIKQVFKQN